MAAGLGALGDDEVAAAGDGSDGVAHLAAHRRDDHPGVVQRVDDVAWDAEPGDEQCGAAIDDVLDTGLDLLGEGGEQVDAERLGRHRSDAGDLVGQLCWAHRRGAERADASGLGDGGDEAVVRDATHPGAHHRVFDPKEVGKSRAHCARP